VLRSSSTAFNFSSFASSQLLCPRFSLTSVASPMSRCLSSSTVAKENFERKIQTPKMTVKQVLAGRPSSTFTVDKTASIQQTISHMVTKKISSCLILEDISKEIVGIVTARDLLRFVNDISSAHVSTRALRGSPSTEAFLTHRVTEVMTPVNRMLYCSPKDTVKHCREIM
jgi:signal-transduction protein with cAMP-binding, CBS, and nucleotidyltransferase domain